MQESQSSKSQSSINRSTIRWTVELRCFVHYTELLFSHCLLIHFSRTHGTSAALKLCALAWSELIRFNSESIQSRVNSIWFTFSLEFTWNLFLRVFFFITQIPERTESAVPFAEPIYHLLGPRETTSGPWGEPYQGHGWWHSPVWRKEKTHIEI